MTDFKVGDTVRALEDFRAYGISPCRLIKGNLYRVTGVDLPSREVHVDRCELGIPDVRFKARRFELVESGSQAVRQFDTGATRNLDTGKLDYEGFLSPLVLERYARYMHAHRQTPAGLRDSDNWQAGIPKDVYMKSLWRHFMDAWMLHRGQSPVSPETGEPVTMEDALSAILFNGMGYMHEILKEKADA